MISYNEALKILNKSIIKIDNEILKIVNSLNRVCSENINSKINYPSANNSSLDGYAVNFKDTKGVSKNKIKKLKIIGFISAGSKPLKKIIKKNEAVEIMTGGIMPAGTNLIIPIEESLLSIDKNQKYIFINKEYKKFDNVRLKGSDYKKNELVIKKNTIIQPNHILAFKTLAIKNIKVKKKINILFFSTGNEVSNKDNIPYWKVRNSNSQYIRNLDGNFLFNFIDGGILKDHNQKLYKSKINEMLKSKINIVITSGAVSAGKFDYVPEVVRSFKLSNYFKSVAIRPGKPILFAKIKNKQKAIFGLPGNPMSSAACFRFFVFPYIEKILGLSLEKPVKATLKNNFIKKKNFTRFVKSKLNTTKNGKIEVEILKGQESFRIKSFVKSNIWALLPTGKSKFKKGEIVDCFFPNQSNRTLI